MAARKAAPKKAAPKKTITAKAQKGIAANAGKLKAKAGVKPNAKLGPDKLAALAKSSDALTRKRAQFAINMAKARKKKKK